MGPVRTVVSVGIGLLVISVCGPAGTGIGWAKIRPTLSPGAAALVAEGGLLLVPGDNLAVPLGGKSKPVPFLNVTPKRLAVVSASPGRALLAIDDELYRLEGATLTLAAQGVGAMPALSADGKLVASVEDKKTLKLVADGKSQAVPYRRQGRWEYDRPYVTPDARWVLATVRDYTQPLDAYVLVVVDPKTREVEEFALSPNFVPGALREPLGPERVAIQMYSQSTDDSGFARLLETDWVVFDFGKRKLEPAPATLRAGLVSPGGTRRLVPGEVVFDEEKRCSADKTRLYTEGTREATEFRAGDGTVVTVLDFLPDESGVVAEVLTLKTCRVRGVVIPLDRDLPPAKWATLALPARDGRIEARVIGPAAGGAGAKAPATAPVTDTKTPAATNKPSGGAAPAK